MLSLVLILFANYLLFIGCVEGYGNGVNLQPSYYNNGNVTFGWNLMKKYSQIKSVRIEIEPDKVSQASNWIKEASSHGYNIIATYHKYSVLGSDDPNELFNAANWWVENYKHLASAGNFVVNMMNEWGSHSQTPSSYANAYNQAIKTLRKVYAGDVIIDIPGWGQETQTASASSSLIDDRNVVFSAHIYSQGWNEAAGHSLEPDDMDVLASSNRPFIVGEFGVEKNDYPVNVTAVVNRAKEVGALAVMAWAWNGDGNDLNMVSPPWYDNPTSDRYSVSSYFEANIALL